MAIPFLSAITGYVEQSMNQLNERAQMLRKPPWLKVRPPYAHQCRSIRTTLADLQLHTVCQEAVCPNMAECFASGTATFLILGNICTRKCLYCNVEHGQPTAIDEKEIAHLVRAVQKMKLEYVVITSVTRDDLPDGGANIFADCISELRKELTDCKIEVLIPDFQGNTAALEKVIAAKPDVINHNMEVVEPLFAQLRPQGKYNISLKLVSDISATTVVSKAALWLVLAKSATIFFDLLMTSPPSPANASRSGSISSLRSSIGQWQNIIIRMSLLSSKKSLIKKGLST